MCEITVLKLCAHVTEGILSARVKLIYATTRKIVMAGTMTAMPKDEQWSVTWFLRLENLLSNIHVRICAVYVVQNVNAKSTVNQWVQRFKVESISTSTNLEVIDCQKEEPSVVCRRHQQTINGVHTTQYECDLTAIQERFMIITSLSVVWSWLRISNHVWNF